MSKSSDVSVLLGDGKGGFAPRAAHRLPAGHSPNDLAAGDFNRDGRLDLAIANHETQHLTVLLGDGRGDLRRHQTRRSPSRSGRIPMA